MQDKLFTETYVRMEDGTTMSIGQAAQQLDLSVGVKADLGKPRTDLLPADALLGVSKVLAFGAQKYADRNWEKGMPWGRIIGAILRHAFEFMLGRNYDPETKLPVADHLLCEALFLSAYFHRKIGKDDRNAVYSTGEKGQPSV